MKKGEIFKLLREALTGYQVGPEMSSLLSVLNHTKHDYVFMCAKEDFSGYHNFTKSWSEHKKNAKRS